MDSPQQTPSSQPASESWLSVGLSVAQEAASSGGLPLSTNDSAPRGYGDSGRRSKYTWQSAPDQWRKVYLSWRSRMKAKGRKKQEPGTADAIAAGLTQNDWQQHFRHNAEWWRWVGDLEELAAEECYAKVAMVKRMVLEAATGQTEMTPLQFAASKEILANMDPEWGKQKVEVAITDPREAAAVEATVSVLLGLIRQGPGAPPTHDLGLPSPTTPEGGKDAS